MARSSPQIHVLQRVAMPLAVAVLLATSVMPTAWLQWVGSIAHLVSTSLTPISHPLSAVAGWLAPATTDGPGTDALRDEAEAYRARWLAADDDNRRLRRIIADLQKGAALQRDLPVRLAVYPVVRTSSEPSSAALTVRAGSDDGVTIQSTFATIGGYELVGRVIQCGPTLCTVLPITDPAGSALLDARIMLDGTEGISCLLQPTPDGSLQGPATVPESSADRPSPPRPEVGMTVRLADESWPRAAQLLTIGVITEVRADDGQPLRPLVTVRPRVQLRRLAEVTLVMPDERPAVGARP